MTTYERIMIWGAHPDDEILMGGTIAAMADAGCEVTVVTISRGDAGYCRPEWAATIAEQRRAEAAACDRIPHHRRIMLGWPDQGTLRLKLTDDPRPARAPAPGPLHP